MRCTSAALLVFLVPHLASAGSALDKPAFTATAAELLAEAKKAPPSDSGAVVLREDDEITFDDQRLGVHRTHLVVRIDSKDGADSWDTIWRDFRPWQQNVPVFRARIVAPSGQVTELDAAKIVDEPQRTGDARQVSAHLPPLAVGSVLEEEITLSDRVPFLGGRSLVSSLGDDDPVESARLTISAPASLKLHSVEHALPKAIRPRHTVASGRATWSYAIDKVPAATYEPKVPEGTFVTPVIGVSTAVSWADAARAYAAIEAPALKVTQPPELPHGDTLEVARAVTAWLHQHVRFDGADLLSAPYDGVQLDAVVKRGTGNTNELALLLVALLRGAGITADVVLVDRDSPVSFDVDRVWLGAFDHALVRARIAGSEVWLDPEDADLPVGTLDGDDQGRRALAIADAALLRTPATGAAANTIREVRTYELSELGNARITEVTREGGTFEAGQRQWFRDTSAGEIRKQLAGYVKSAYGGEVDTYSTTSPDDLTHPFELTIAVNNAPRGYTAWSKIDVYLYAWDTLARIDSVLASDTDTPRKYDLAIQRPHIYEIENRLVVPEGFTLPAAQPDRTRNVGPFRLVERQQVAGHTLIITFRLEADRTRMTPAEVTETRRAAKDLRGDATHIVIEHTGWALMHAGEHKKALAELQRLIALQPRDALHHARLAQLLIQLDDGDGARREARKAVELDPKSADAHVALGWVLTHDLVGRQWARGFDRAGARAAYAKAHALDPKHVGAAVELAQLLERDDRGRKLEPGADLRAASDAWRAAIDLDPTDDRRRSLVRTLLWSGDAAAAATVARQLPASRERDGMVTASIALTEGVDAAVREAGRGDRTASLQAGGALLMLLRQYDLSRKLLAQVGGSSAINIPQEMFDRLRREDAPFRPTADPKDVVTELSLELIDPDRPYAVEWDKQVVDDMKEEARSAPTGRKDMLTMPVLTDITRTMTNTQVDGDADAWRADARVSTGTDVIIYLASDGKFPKVIGTPHHLKGVGRHVLRLAGKHDDAAARLLDWVVKDVHNPGLRVVWGPSLPRDTRAIQLAGALLADDPARSLEVATKCLVTTTQAQFVCDLLVADAYTKQKKWAELDTFVEQTWAPRAPKSSEIPAHTRAIALMHLARWDDAKRVLDEALARKPDDRRAMTLRAQLAVHQGERDDALQRLQALAQQPNIRGSELNSIAWLKVVANLDIPDVRALAKKATELEPKDANIMNTLAGVDEETGDLKAAAEDLRKSVDLEQDGLPESGDWYILGRMLEKVGLRDDAIAAYRRVTKHHDELFTADTYQLASERLKALGAPRK